jgi:hypothetical protein
MSRTTDPEVATLKRRLAELEEANLHASKLREAEALVAALADGTDPSLGGSRIKFSRSDKHDSRANLVAKLTEYLKVDPKLAAGELEEVKLNYAREAIAPADRPAPDIAGHANADGADATAPANGVEAQGAADLILKYRREGQSLTMPEAVQKFRQARRPVATV